MLVTRGRTDVGHQRAYWYLSPEGIPILVTRGCTHIGHLRGTDIGHQRATDRIVRDKIILLMNLWEDWLKYTIKVAEDCQENTGLFTRNIVLKVAQVCQHLKKAMSWFTQNSTSAHQIISLIIINCKIMFALTYYHNVSSNRKNIVTTLCSTHFV